MKPFLILLCAVSMGIICLITWKYSPYALYSRINILEEHTDKLAHAYQNLQYQVDVISVLKTK